jgi:hypothetical protein
VLPWNSFHISFSWKDGIWTVNLLPSARSAGRLMIQNRNIYDDTSF